MPLSSLYRGDGDSDYSPVQRCRPDAEPYYPTGKINAHYSCKAGLCIVAIMADATNGGHYLQISFSFRRR